MRNFSSYRFAAAIAIACAILGPIASGQVHQVQQGNVLDANPGVGMGGTNAPIPGYVPINGNEIVTGNVAGLKYFHGPVGTRSPFEFQGQLGTSSLNNFARQSAPAGVSGISQSYYLPSSTVSIGLGSLYQTPYVSGFDSRMVPRYVVAPTANVGQNGVTDSLAAGVPFKVFDRSDVLVPNTTGGSAQILSSPLFSLRSQPILPTEYSGKPIDGSSNTLNPLTTQPAGTRPGTDPDADPAIKTSRSDVQRRDAAIDSQNNQRISAVPPDVKGARQTMTITADARQSETYQTLISELNKAQAGPDGSMPGKGTATRPAGKLLAGANGIDPFTNQPRKISPAPTTGPGAKPPVDLPASRLEDLPTRTLQAGKDIKPLDSFAKFGGDPTTFDTYMLRAEKLLKDGKFLDAANEYQSALMVEPDNALALIGRAHAELGAGMFQSAAYDLKFLFTRKPEMLSVHYQMQTFISPSRQNALIKDLESLSAAKDVGNMASFLYCYLCYQTGRQAQLQTELLVWANRPGRDTWQSVLNRAWSGAKDAGDKK